MPHFKVILSGRGINILRGHVPSIGFFTTRLVRAADVSSAETHARQLVLSEWQAGGECAQHNLGELPELSVEQSFQVGWFEGMFGRRPSGYTFYRSEG